MAFASAGRQGGEAIAPPATSRSRWLLLILLLALLLRLWNIDYPAWNSPDEQNMVDRALLLGHAGMNPRWFAYPSLFLYLLFAADAAFYVGGRLLGVFASPAQFAEFYFADPLPLHLIARGIALACGMACLAMTYRIGRTGWGTGVGLMAAGILAASPTFVLASRLAKPDILMTLLLLVATWALFGYLDTPRTAWLAAAGVAVGLAAAAKYTAGLGAILLLVAPWIRRRGQRAAMEGALGLGLAALGFVAGTPFAVLDWPTFRPFFTAVASLMRGSWYGAEDRLGYVFYLVHTLPLAFGWPAMVLGIVGSGRWVLRGGPRERLLAGFAAGFYGWMGYSRVAGDHYILPILPILALAGADAVQGMTAGVRKSHPAWCPWIVGGLATICLLQPLARSMRETVLLAARDTRELAGIWIAGHLEPGTRIVSEPFGPFLPVTAGRLNEMITEQERREPGHGMRLRSELARTKLGEGFWYYEIPLFRGWFMARPATEEYDLDRFLSQGYRVVVLSSAVYDRYRRFPELYPIQNAFFDRVSRSGTLLVHIGPTSPWCCPDTLNARLSEAAARSWGRPGPTLLLYRLPD